MSQGWIGVDLDGTLAEYEPGSAWNGVEIGPPVPAMVARVRRWLAEGRDVRIFTARMAPINGSYQPDLVVRTAIVDWCVAHIGKALPITATKDYHMLELWDDRAVQVERNTGRPVGHSTRGLDDFAPVTEQGEGD